jgi:hypothetical protein
VDRIDALIDRMQGLLEPMASSDDERRHFLATYLRTTIAVRGWIERGAFLDTDWTQRWDVEFADLYLQALESWNATGTAPGPWSIAFAAAAGGPRIPPVRHVLLGMNAHVNYDLPQALIAVITDDEFDDPAVVARRASDHERIDDILSSRVAQEDVELRKVERPGDRTLVDHLLTPFNRAGSRKFLKEARGKVWRNARLLSEARRDGLDTLTARIEELGRLSADRVADLQRPGQVLLRLARRGFGVLLENA